MDILLEQFNLDPLGSIDIDPFQIFNINEAAEEWHSIYEDATTGTTKQNAFHKLWNFIMKGLKWLQKQFSRFIAFIKKIFTNGKVKKTADQAAEDSGLKPNTGSGSDSAAQSELSAQSVSNTSGSKSSVNISIPSDKERSQVEMPDINVISKDLIVKFAEGGKFTIDTTDIDDRIKFGSGSPKKSQGPIKGKSKGGRMRLVTLLMYLNEPEKLTKLEQTITSIFEGKKDFTTIHSLAVSLNNEIIGIFDFSDKVYTVDQCLEFQKRLNEMIQKFETFHDDNLSFGNPNEREYEDTILIINGIAEHLANLQMCMNALTTAFTHAFLVDEKYMNTVNDIETLSKFVETCINAGIPHKYLGYNVYLVSTPALKGNGDNGDQNNPIWGQSRVVLYPNQNKRVVYKVALSRWGIGANYSEYQVSEKMKNKTADCLALTKSITANHAVTSMERLVLPDRNTVREMDLENLRDILKNDAEKLNMRMDISGDIHAGNIGYKDPSDRSKFACIDYGWLDRMSVK